VLICVWDVTAWNYNQMSEVIRDNLGLLIVQISVSTVCVINVVKLLKQWNKRHNIPNRVLNYVTSTKKLKILRQKNMWIILTAVLNTT